MVDKKYLRPEIKKRLREIPEAVFKTQCEQLSLKLKGVLDSFKLNPSKIVIGAFAPMKKEANFLPHLESYQDSLAFPSFIEGGENEMEFLKSTYADLIESKDFGLTIKGPLKDCSKVNPDLVIVPGLAFDSFGARLGRGGGYYDRYLKDHQGLKVGVALKEQILEKIPTEAHDIKVDVIVSDEEVIIINQNAVDKWQKNITRTI